MRDESVSLKILAIEDEDALRASLVDFFQDNGHKVFEAANISDGLQAFRSHSPDIVLTDLCMPNGNGLDLIPLLKKESPTTPVVVISGVGKLEDAVEAMKRGAWDYIPKPIRRLDDLEGTIQFLARQSRIARQVASTTQGNANPGSQRDPLTRLPGRSHLVEVFERISREQAYQLLVLDIDDLKIVNDTLGHNNGDLLLHEVAQRLTALTEPDETLVRLCGDKFALLADFFSKERVVAIQDAFSQPFSLAERELFITVSGGIARFPEDAASMEDLLRFADFAMEEAKSRGKGRIERYQPDYSRSLDSRLDITTRLRKALARDEFLLYYQPQIEASSGRLIGVEALLRWHPMESEIVNPATFIPLLEESGLIIPVGEWVLRSACEQHVAWLRNGYSSFKMSVNISALQFHSGSLVDTVNSILAETSMDPSLLCLELTEGIVMRDIDETIVSLNRLVQLGVTLSIDDFGTGYSSLNYLLRMPIDEIKIDKTFIDKLPAQQEQLSIVNAIITIASAMNLHVVAEGVESAEQLACLQEAGCPYIQGYYYSRPLPAAQLEKVFLEDSRGRI